MDSSPRSTNHFITLKDYTWLNTRIPLVGSWLGIMVLSLSIYFVVVFFIKVQQMDTSLSVASHTIVSAIEAGDWELARGHLDKLISNGEFSSVELSMKGQVLFANNNDSTFGMLNSCRISNYGGRYNYKLSACVYLVSMLDMIFVLSFLLFSVGILILMYLFFRKSNEQIIGEIGSFLSKLREKGVKLDDSECKQISELLKIKSDFTELLKQEAEAARLEVTNDISARLAHDLRSPLMALQALASSAQLNETQKRLLIGAMERTKNLADQLVKAQSKANEENKVDLSSEEKKFSTGDIESFFRQKQMEHSGTSAELILDTQIENAVFCNVDKHDAFRVISNLINNSIEAFENGHGTVQLTVKDSGSFVLFEVADTGKGIPKESLTKVVEKGFSKGKARGTGLGLFMAKKFVDDARGTFLITSKVGVGTVIKFSLPKVSVDEDRPSAFF